MAVVLKDAWARIEPHGRELRHMGAHGATWTRTDCTQLRMDWLIDWMSDSLLWHSYGFIIDERQD